MACPRIPDFVTCFAGYLFGDSEAVVPQGNDNDLSLGRGLLHPRILDLPVGIGTAQTHVENVRLRLRLGNPGIQNPIRLLHARGGCNARRDVRDTARGRIGEESGRDVLFPQDRDSNQFRPVGDTVHALPVSQRPHGARNMRPMVVGARRIVGKPESPAAQFTVLEVGFGIQYGDLLALTAGLARGASRISFGRIDQWKAIGSFIFPAVAPRRRGGALVGFRKRRSSRLGGDFPDLAL